MQPHIASCKPFRALFMLLVLSSTLSLPAQTVKDQDADSIVHLLSNRLEAEYPFPDISARYKRFLLTRLRNGAYKNLSEAALAEKLTADLRSVHKDRHLVVRRDEDAFIAATTPADTAGTKNTTAETLSYEGNYGFDKVEIDRYYSIAYISVPGPWYSVPEAYSAASSVMNLATGSKYIIIDVRLNGGGSGAIGRFLASYFYPEGAEQYYLYGFHKDKNRDEQEWTFPFVPGKTAPNAKLYILTSRSTGSAAEGFAFALQQLKRGIVVGDTTAGAGIAGSLLPLKCNLMFFLPVKMIVAPHTTKGWEGTGVVPDIATGKDDALAYARKIILKDLLEQEKDEHKKAILNWQIEDLSFDEHKPLDWQRYRQLVYEYSPKVAIRQQDNKLLYCVTREDKTSCYELVEVVPDVLLIRGLNPEWGINASRLYITRDALGNITGITRKAYIAAHKQIAVGNKLDRTAKP